MNDNKMINNNKTNNSKNKLVMINNMMSYI
jgi:hypothetical protein